MKVYWLVIIIAILITGPGRAASKPAAALKEDIEKQGAKTVVNYLRDHDKWQAVMDHIASGKSEWIALAPLLAPGTDAGTSEDLPVSLAFALPKNPQAVLKTADDPQGSEAGILGIKDICGVPFIEDTKPRHYVAKAMKALESVQDPALSAKKEACVAELKKEEPGHY